MKSIDEVEAVDVPIEIYDYNGPGYAPLLLEPGWQVALLNWEPACERANLKEIERHNQTDEVFVLLRGRSALFVKKEGGALRAFDCQPGVIYNVPAGVWHTLVADHEATFLIVENRDTHLYDTEVRPITAAELAEVDAALPDWARMG